MSQALPLRPVRAPALPAFLVLAVAVAGAGVVALERSGGEAVVVTAVTLDLVVVLPLAWYLLGVRWGGLPAITVLPVFRLSLALAGALLPAGDRALHDALAWLARPAELGVAAWVAWRVGLGWRAWRGVVPGDDVAARYRVAFRAALPPTVPRVERAADAMAFEAALVWFATRWWRRTPEHPPGAVAFTGHRTAGWGGVVAGLLMVVAVEVVVVHLLVSTWSVAAAWVLTGLGLYGAVWLLGDYRALRLRPSWLQGDRLCLRLGLRWQLTVPLADVRRARRLATGEDPGDALVLSLPGAPRVLVELDSPATAVGIYGIRRATRAVVLGVDEPEELLRRVGRGR